jgi:DNA-directed RNA polymerase specialized sigma24 family protein
MSTSAIATNLFPRTYLTVVEDGTCIAEQKIEKHESLLMQIVTGLGFNKVESNQIIDEVRLQAQKQFRDYSGLFPFKLWLTKTLVRKCIFKISQDLFNGVSNAQVFGGFSTAKNIFGGRQEQIPLSFFIVYLLHDIGFTEREIAEILNTSTMNVKERLNKALQFIART